MTKIKNSGIKSLPDYERPREKMLKLGEAALSDRELLSLIIESGTQKMSALELADKILLNFDGMPELLNTTVEELRMISGIGPAKAVKIKAAMEMANRCLHRDIVSKQKINGPEDIYQLLKFKLDRERKEHFVIVLVNTKNILIKIESVTIGILDSSLVHPREVFSRAVKASSAGIILVHNHPSGDPNPSSQDLKLTEELIDCGNMMGIPVLDHIIIGAGGYYSYSSEKEM